ncbi:MAG: hypothetical protein ACQCN6_00320 [Candidatus Bathyarchaeia archaeon]|jgi:hypothetical protein
MSQDKKDDELQKIKGKVSKLTADRPLVTDIISKLIITFGVVLLISGLYLMLVDSGLMGQEPLANSAMQTATAVVSWVPGIPFSTSDLVGYNITTIGLVSWIVGIDLLLVGLGVWARHRLALLAAVVIFVLAAGFQFYQFFMLGIAGAPASLVGLCINGVIAYFLFLTFNWAKQPTH